MTTQFKVGDVVKCIDREVHGANNVIPPEVGTVEKVEGFSFLHLQGVAGLWSTGRFVLAEPEGISQHYFSCLEPAEGKEAERAPAAAAASYTASNLAHEAKVAALQQADDEMSGRRAALVKRLRSELDRPAPKRFPHEARSDRVSGYRRWT